MTSRTNSAPAPKKTRIERILEPFGPRHAAGLIAFFDRIAEADFDLVLFIARKCLCIYRMMQLCGVKKISVPVYSDALLESDPAIIANKRVLVVDDTLLVGTTLSDTKKQLIACGPAKLEFWVYCADGDTWSPDTFMPDLIHTTLSAQETIEFCGAECRAMINAGIPYLSDFAASNRIRFTPTQLDQAIKPVSWFFYDVSSQYHETSKVHYYSALPDKRTNEFVQSVIGSSIFDLIEIAKIRAFATWTGRAYEVTFVPIITFSPTDRKSLRRAVRALCDAFCIDHSIFSPSTVTEKMRFLQYMIGAIFLRAYWESVDHIIKLSPDSRFSFEWCATVFSPTQSEYISTVIAEIYRPESTLPTVSPDPRPLVRSEPADIKKETNDDIAKFLEDFFSGDPDVNFGHSPLSDLTAIFLEFQSRFETAARREVVDKAPNPTYRDRLKRGIAWRALCACLLRKYGWKNTRYNRNILSLVLDRLIDFGVAVPIIATSGDFVYRAYRHGEDVKFGAQEENLVFNLLKGFQAGRGSEGIESTYIEKLIVILLRVGMNEEWLNLWYSNSGRDTLVRVGYHLQGAVPISPRREDELVPEGESSWLSRRLLKTGTIRRASTPDRPGLLYHLGVTPQAAHVRTDAPRTATALGNTLGKACVFRAQQRSADRPLSSEDLIVLTSCANPLDITGSIAAELRIFCEWYESQGARILRSDFTNPRSHNFRIRVTGSRGAEAINSAGWKLRKYAENAIGAIRTKIAILKASDPDWVIREGYWDAIFEAFHRALDPSEERKLARIRGVASELLTCFKFLLETLDRLAELGRRPNDHEKRHEFCANLSSAGLPSVVPASDFAGLASLLAQPNISVTAVKRALCQVAQSIDAYGRSLCALAGEEATAAERLILKANQKLSRIQYSLMAWYDIIDVRVRKQGTPEGTDKYALAIDEFRENVNSILSNAQDRIRADRGDLFCDSGDIASFNDAKHIFLNLPGGAFAEGNRIVCDIIRIAESAGVQLRMLVVPTNLRGEYVYLNRGSTSVDGDFKSHVHTIIQSIQHHDAEQDLRAGECIVWTPDQYSEDLRSYGSVRLEKAAMKETLDVAVNIRGFIVNTRVVFLKSGAE